MFKRIIIVCCLIVVGTGVNVTAGDGIEETKQEIRAMFTQYTETNPRKIMLPEYDPDSHPDSRLNDWTTIKALTYDGALSDGKKTKVFAYIGLPKGADVDSKCPAVVLVHGGAGHPFAEWIKIWNDRGYAAIAMDTTGYFPSPEGKGKAGRESDFYQTIPFWQYGLYGTFAEQGYVNAPDNDFMNSAGVSYDEQWMYHAVSQVILAHNVLRNEPVIDAERIGLVGISWGGVISSITIGYDNRFAFAVPIYGTGHLDKGLTYMKDYFSPEPIKSYWSAADRFSLVDIPVLWLCWANDPSFSIQSNSRSYMDTRKAGSVLSILNDWSHGHSGGWNQRETYRFADSVAKGNAGLTECLTEPGATRNFDFLIKRSSDAVSVIAKAYYITEKMTYSMNGTLSEIHKLPTIDQTWKTVTCNTDGDTVYGTLPENAYSFYVEIDTYTQDGYFVTTSSFFERITGEGEVYSGSSSSNAIVSESSGVTSVMSSDLSASSVSYISSSSSSSVSLFSSSSDVLTSTESLLPSSDPKLSDDLSLPALSPVSIVNEVTGRNKGWLYTVLAIVGISALILCVGWISVSIRRRKQKDTQKPKSE